MFMVRNETPREIALGDLRITLRSKQQLDLDKVCSRYVAEQSDNLRSAIKKNLVKIIQKDDPNLSFAKPSVEKSEAIPDGITNSDLKKMEERLLAQMQKQSHDKSPALDISELQSVLQKLTEMVSSQSQVKPVNTEEDSEIPEDKMNAIHMRSVNKLTSESKANIDSSKNVEINKSKMNIDELENLI